MARGICVRAAGDRDTFMGRSEAEDGEGIAGEIEKRIRGSHAAATPPAKFQSVNNFLQKELAFFRSAYYNGGSESSKTFRSIAPFREGRLPGFV